MAVGFTANAYHNNEVGRALAETGLDEVHVQRQQPELRADGRLLARSFDDAPGARLPARYDENSRVNPLADPTAAPALANLNERYRRLDSTLGHNLGRRQFIQLGAEWVQDQYRGANRLVGDNAGQQVTTTDGWLQDRIQLFSRATLTLGGRYQNHRLWRSLSFPRSAWLCAP